MNFIDLRVPNPLINALNDLGFVYPTPIQQKCYRRITSGADVVGIAQTGTGKTFAYLLPLIAQLEYSKQKHPRVLIIVPTRELVKQVHDEASKLIKYKNIRIKSVYGGTNINTQKNYVYDKGCDIIIGTPGRLFDIAVTGVLRFTNIKKVVIDEVDEMLSLGFRPQLEQIFEMLPVKRQHMMFSATLSDEVSQFIKKYFYQPEEINIENKNTPVDKISQIAINIPNFYSKINYLTHILSEEEFIKVLIFANNKKDADLIFSKLDVKFTNLLGVIHSNKSQNFRFNSIKNFEKGKTRILIATDVVARGLDFTNISHVISINPPENPPDYIHRIGRTGRAENEGKAILLYTPYEENAFIAVKSIAGPGLIENNLPRDIAISTHLTENEKPGYRQKNYLKQPDISKSGGAFHKKSIKRQKENSGGMRQKAKKKRR